MSTKATQTLYAAIVSLVFVISIYRLGRKQRLSFRYSAGWMSLGLVGVIAGALSPLAEPVAGYFGVSPAALLAIGALILLLALCVQLSISISGLQEQVRRVSEQVALLRGDLEEASTETDDAS